jgi:hypothetical protein
MSPTPSPAFDLSAHLAAYQPRDLDPGVWAQLCTAVGVLMTTTCPTSRADASGLLSALTRFLPAAAGRGPVCLDLLTAENVDRFCAIERARGVSEASLGQVRPRLRRLVTAYRSTAAPVDLGPQWPRFTEFDPYTDAEFESLSRLADTLPADLGRALRCALSLVGLHGLSRAQMETATVTDGILIAATLDHPRQLAASDPLLVLAQGADVSVSKATWACLRRMVKAEAGMPLRMHRLRVRWLLHVLSTDQPVADVMRIYGLGRDDLETALLGLPVSPDAHALLRAM